MVYKVDRLSRWLLDFARLMDTFERHNISFVSVTQQFNTATSMGRLLLNVLLSFAPLVHASGCGYTWRRNGSADTSLRLAAKGITQWEPLLTPSSRTPGR